jgi:hypothetical protein
MLNKLSGCVDRDFESDVGTRESMTGYLMSLNGVPISRKSSRQGHSGVTLSCSEAECHGDMDRGRLARTYTSREGDMSSGQLAPVLTIISSVVSRNSRRDTEEIRPD